METSFAAKPHQANRLKARKYLQDLSRYEVKVKVTTCNVRHQLNTKTITSLGQGDQTPPPRYM